METPLSKVNLVKVSRELKNKRASFQADCRSTEKLRIFATTIDHEGKVKAFKSHLVSAIVYRLTLQSTLQIYKQLRDLLMCVVTMACVHRSGSITSIQMAHLEELTVDEERSLVTFYCFRPALLRKAKQGKTLKTKDLREALIQIKSNNKTGPVYEKHANRSQLLLANDYVFIFNVFLYIQSIC